TVQVLLGPDGTLQRSVVEGEVDRLVYRVQDRLRGNPTVLAWRAETVAASSPLADRFSSFSQAVAGTGVMFILLCCILCGALGLISPALARREENVQMLGGPVGLVMADLGGGMFPVEMAPPWMQRLALVFPTGWAMQAYHMLMWDGAGLPAVLPHLLVLAGF